MFIAIILARLSALRCLSVVVGMVGTYLMDPSTIRASRPMTFRTSGAIAATSSRLPDSSKQQAGSNCTADLWNSRTSALHSSSISLRNSATRCLISAFLRSRGPLVSAVCGLTSGFAFWYA